MHDARIWTPDHTCLPFEIECCSNIAGVVAAFRLASNLTGVIRSVGTNVGATQKDTLTIRIVEGAPGISLGNDINLHGALLDVQEFGNSGVNVPGLVGAGVRPCCIPLRPGTPYQVFQSSAVVIPIVLFGWTWKVP